MSQIRSTSRAAYEDLKSSGRQGIQQGFLLGTLIKCRRGMTRRELTRLTGLEINAVCGRVNELLKKGAIAEGGPRKCRVSGRMVLEVTAMAP